MCLGVPGAVLDIRRELGGAVGEVDFGGARRAVSLAFVPEVEVGDHVIVHAGVAIARLDAEAAAETLRLMGQAGLGRAGLGRAEGERS